MVGDNVTPEQYQIATLRMRASELEEENEMLQIAANLMRDKLFEVSQHLLQHGCRCSHWMISHKPTHVAGGAVSMACSVCHCLEFNPEETQSAAIPEKEDLPESADSECGVLDGAAGPRDQQDAAGLEERPWESGP